MKINCIILDDDPAVICYLKDYTRDIPFLNLIGTFTSPVLALAEIQQQEVQLIFTDIGMPGLSGMELAKSLGAIGGAVPRVVFISGFEQFALESYQVNALDYLVKPVSFANFLKTAQKAQHYFTTVQGGSLKEFIFVKVEHDMVRVLYRDILYLESFKDYVKIYCTDGRMVKALTTLKNIEEKLPSQAFMRIHRSFIVSLDKISSVHHQVVQIGRELIPVTEQYRARFKTYIDPLTA